MAASDTPDLSKRQQLLEAARSVIAERGFDNTPVSAIVERAGVSQGTFYTYFAAKTDLPAAFASAIRQSIITANVRHLQKSLTPAELFPLIIREAFKVVENFRDILICIDLATILGEFERDLNDPVNQMKSHMISKIKAWQSTKQVRSDLHPEICTHLLSGTIQRMFTDLVVKGINIDREFYIDQAVTFICLGLGAEPPRSVPAQTTVKQPKV